MNPQPENQQALPPPQPLQLEGAGPALASWSYPVLGLVCGAFAGVLLFHPLAMVVFSFQQFVHGLSEFDLFDRILASFVPHMWPMMTLFSIFGGIIGAVLGQIYQRLKEHQRQIETLHQEFELQVASLRHHYKNLTIGIEGFSTRLQRKITGLSGQIKQKHGEACPLEDCYCNLLPGLEKDVETLADTTKRLNETLGMELTFLKALTSGYLSPEPHDLYPILVGAIRDLLEVRFRKKEMQVQINGRPYLECRESLVFNFELVTLEVILENILSNAMKYGDQIRVNVAETAGAVQIAVLDNGPGFQVGELRKRLLAPWDRREMGSTQLGLRVTLHLLEKCGGRLLVSSQPGAGSNFTLEFPD